MAKKSSLLGVSVARLEKEIVPLKQVIEAMHDDQEMITKMGWMTIGPF